MLERVLALRQPLDEEVRAAVPDLLVAAEPQVPLVTGRKRYRLAPRRPRVPQMDVLGLVPGPDREMDLDLVAHGEQGALRERPQDDLLALLLALEIGPLDREQVSVALLGHLLGAEVPGRAGEGHAFPAFGHPDRRALRPDLVPGDDQLIFLARVLVRLEGERRLRAAGLGRDRLPDGERARLLQKISHGVDDLGRGPRRLPVVELLVEEEPLDESLAPRVGRFQLHERPQGEGVRLDRVVVPEPAAVLRGPARPAVDGRLGAVHDAVPDERRVLRPGRPLERKRQISLEIGGVVWPVLEREVEHLLSIGVGEDASRPRCVGEIADRVVEEGDEFPARIVGHEGRYDLVEIMPVQVGEGPDHGFLGHVDAELERLGEAVNDVQGHIGRRRPARPPRESAERGLGLEEFRQRRLSLGLGHARVEHLFDAHPRVLAAARRFEPGRLLEGHLPVRIGGVERLVDRLPLAQLLGHARDLRIFIVEARQDAGRKEAVERLLRALVGIIDEVGQGFEEPIEELGVHGDHELFVDARRVVRLGQVVELELARLALLDRREPRLDEMHPSRQDRQRPELAVGQGAGLGHDLEGDRAHPRRRGQREDDGRPAPGLDLERPGRHARRKPKSRGQVLVRQRVEDLQRDLARERRVPGVVDHDPQIGLVAFAEEARQIGPDHEVFHRLRLRLERPAHQVPGHAVDEDAPARHGVGHGEFDGRRPVRPREKMGLPEGRLGEIRAELGGLAARRRRFLRRQVRFLLLLALAQGHLV